MPVAAAAVVAVVEEQLLLLLRQPCVLQGIAGVGVWPFVGHEQFPKHLGTASW